MKTIILTFFLAWSAFTTLAAICYSFQGLIENGDNSVIPAFIFLVLAFLVSSFYSTSVEKKWNLKRAIRVSSKFALLYFFISAIWIWIFGVKSEIKLAPWSHLISNQEYILPFDSWLIILLNLWAILIFGILFFKICMILGQEKGLGQVLCSTSEEDRPWIKSINLFYGAGIFMWAAIIVLLLVTIGPRVGLAIGMLYGLIYGFPFFLCFVFFGVIIWIGKHLLSKKFWKKIAVGISLGWSWLIQ